MALAPLFAYRPRPMTTPELFQMAPREAEAAVAAVEQTLKDDPFAAEQLARTYLSDPALPRGARFLLKRLRTQAAVALLRLGTTGGVAC